MQIQKEEEEQSLPDKHKTNASSYAEVCCSNEKPQAHLVKSKWQILARDIFKAAQSKQTQAPPSLTAINQRINIFRAKTQQTDLLALLNKHHLLVQQQQIQQIENEKHQPQTQTGDVTIMNKMSQKIASHSQSQAQHQEEQHNSRLIELIDGSDLEMAYFSYKKNAQENMKKQRTKKKDEALRRQRILMIAKNQGGGGGSSVCGGLSLSKLPSQVSLVKTVIVNSSKQKKEKHAMTRQQSKINKKSKSMVSIYSDIIKASLRSRPQSQSTIQQYKKLQVSNDAMGQECAPQAQSQSNVKNNIKNGDSPKQTIQDKLRRLFSSQNYKRKNENSINNDMQLPKWSFQTQIGQLLFSVLQKSQHDQKQFFQSASEFIENYDKKSEETLVRLKEMPIPSKKFIQQQNQKYNLLIPQFERICYKRNLEQQVSKQFETIIHDTKNLTLKAGSPEQDFFFTVKHIANGPFFPNWHLSNSN